MPKFLFFASIYLLCALPAFAWQGRVVSVSAGDTLAVQPVDGGDQVQVKLWGIACPSISQPGGYLAKSFVDNLCLFTVVNVKDKVLSPSNQLLATVHLDDGSTLQQQLLQSGLAWVYDKECRGCYRWKMTEREAQKESIGIWKQDAPIPPWEWAEQNG